MAAYGQINVTNVKNVANNNVNTSGDGVQTFSITNASTEDFAEAKRKYKDKTFCDTATLKKKNGIIKLPVDQKWRPFVIFTDTLLNTDEGKIRKYQYLGQFDNIGFYIVDGNFYEHYECYLIDKRTGNKTTTWNRPFLSPTSRYFANLSMPYGLEGVPNGIQIWKVETSNQNYLSKYLELDQQIWVPDDFVWESDNSLLLRVVSVDKFWNKNGQVNDKDYYYLRLKL